ncbi:hypothetical protein AAFF_G00302260 [Aldrovandia affinis]|uniref:Uncharacterized protein n=1 Tax=Aldrovandia affinis TaxID=143900 RepID=A0AAD7R8X1_9TELE|nr:hypothetical protein AAFF_G00302260 [Aldrovandia affinis]
MKVRQAELKVEETRLAATLNALHQQCDAEAALAEASVYEAAANEVEVEVEGPPPKVTQADSKPASDHDEEPADDHGGERASSPPVAEAKCTQVAESSLDPRRFESFSSWRSLLRAVARLIHIASSFKRGNDKSDCQALSPENLDKAKTVVIRSLQRKAFPEVFACIQAGKEIPKQSQLRKLSPYIDKAGCLRVGGRLSQADLESDERNPLIISRQHHVTTLLIRHYHQKVQHQGRHFTEVWLLTHPLLQSVGK